MQDLADDVPLEDLLEVACRAQHLREEARVQRLVRESQVPDDAAVVFGIADLEARVPTERPDADHQDVLDGHLAAP